MSIKLSHEQRDVAELHLNIINFIVKSELANSEVLDSVIEELRLEVLEPHVLEFLQATITFLNACKNDN